jgi:hypothetical protein
MECHGIYLRNSIGVIITGDCGLTSPIYAVGDVDVSFLQTIMCKLVQFHPETSSIRIYHRPNSDMLGNFQPA